MTANPLTPEQWAAEVLWQHTNAEDGMVRWSEAKSAIIAARDLALEEAAAFVGFDPRSETAKSFAYTPTWLSHCQKLAMVLRARKSNP